MGEGEREEKCGGEEEDEGKEVPLMPKIIFYYDGTQMVCINL